MKKLQILLILIICLLLNIIPSFASSGDMRIDISPPNFIIEANPGEIISKKIKISNYTNTNLNIYTGKSDLQIIGDNGNVEYVSKERLVNKNQMISDWINVPINNFSLNKNEIKEIEFTINIPLNAVPGGHYGAVGFKNNNYTSSSSSGNIIYINNDYFVNILLNIKGEIITNISTKEANISTGKSGYYESQLINDKCIIDFSEDRNDGKCFEIKENILETIFGKSNDTYISIINELNDIYNNKSSINSSKKDDFAINFELAVENSGNTHINPDIKVKILEIDENGNKKELTNIGKEIEFNDKGAEIGEKIVDYLPLNDKKSYILPGTTKNYKLEWKGFPYEGLNEKGQKVIKYLDPSKYYTKQNIQNIGFIPPWKRIIKEVKSKKYDAILNLSYVNEEGEVQEYPSAKEFEIKYEDIRIKYNPYIIFFIIFIVIFIIISIFYILKKKYKNNINNDTIKLVKTHKKKRKISENKDFTYKYF